MRRIIAGAACAAAAAGSANVMAAQTRPLAIASNPVRRIVLPSGQTSIAVVEPLASGAVLLVVDGVALTYRAGDTLPAQAALRRATETNGPRNVAVCQHGRLATFDPSHGQLRVFDPTGAYLSETPWPDSLGGRRFTLIGCPDSVVFGFWERAAAPGTRTLVQNYVTAVVATTRGRLIAKLGDVSSSRMFRGLIQPFTARAVGAAHGSAMAWGTGDSNVVHVRAVASAHACAWRISELRRTPVTSTLRDQWLRAFQARTPKTIYSQVQPILNSLPWPAVTPYWDTLIIDDDDRVWVRAFDPALPSATSAETWWLYEPLLKKARRLTLPAGFALRAISDGVAWINRRDGDGSTVEGYEIANLGSAAKQPLSSRECR
jgi:hypothetical protein